MKLPRGVPAERLINALEAVGYVVIRQKGATSGCGTKDLPPTRLRSRFTTRSRHPSRNSHRGCAHALDYGRLAR